MLSLPYPQLPLKSTFLLNSLFFFRERNICCSTYLCIHWLILVCTLTGIEPTNLGAPE